MTTMTEARPRITRPGAGVAIDPKRLTALRELRLMKRRQLSEAVGALGWTEDSGELLTLGQDIIGKYETGTRKPSMDAFRALCEVLECEPKMLMPGGPPITMPEEAVEREARLDHNRELRDFARAFGLRYKNHATQRVYYRRELKAAYLAWVEVRIAERAGDEAGLAGAREAFSAALAKAPKDPQVSRDQIAHLEEVTGIKVPMAS